MQEDPTGWPQPHVLEQFWGLYSILHLELHILLDRDFPSCTGSSSACMPCLGQFQG